MIADNNPTRRNLIISSLCILTFYFGEGRLNDTIKFPLVSLEFMNTHAVVFIFWVIYSWFIYSYYISEDSYYNTTNKPTDIATKIIDKANQLINERKIPIIEDKRTKILNHLNQTVDKSQYASANNSAFEVAIDIKAKPWPGKLKFINYSKFVAKGRLKHSTFVYDEQIGFREEYNFKITLILSLLKNSEIIASKLIPYFLVELVIFTVFHKQFMWIPTLTEWLLFKLCTIFY